MGCPTEFFNRVDIAAGRVGNASKLMAVVAESLGGENDESGADGTVYFSRDASEPVKIASITKVMTAIVALENASLDTVVTVDEEAATVGESSAGLLQGDSMDLQTALYALMVPSGNDAAVAIAKCVGPLLPS